MPRACGKFLQTPNMADAGRDSTFVFWPPVVYEKQKGCEIATLTAFQHAGLSTIRERLHHHHHEAKLWYARACEIDSKFL
jgi:hypothetical protein